MKFKYTLELEDGDNGQIMMRAFIRDLEGHTVFSEDAADSTAVLIGKTLAESLPLVCEDSIGFTVFPGGKTKSAG